jgi:hypothetical protein
VCARVRVRVRVRVRAVRAVRVRAHDVPMGGQIRRVCALEMKISKCEMKIWTFKLGRWVWRALGLHGGCWVLAAFLEGVGRCT